MANLSSTLEQIASNLNDRRLQFRYIERVIGGFIGNTLEHTVVAMAIPMIYAHWEGYVKEICQLYLEHIEHSVQTGYSLAPVLLGYLWSPVLRPLSGGINTQRQADVARKAVRSLNSRVLFSDSEKEINTRSNLDFDQLTRIAEQLCIDVTSLSTHRHSLDSLVHIRNNIAHGSIPQQLRLSDLRGRISSTERLMADFETQIIDALRRRTFVSRAGADTA